MAKELENLLGCAWQPHLGSERGFAHKLPDSKPGFDTARAQRTPATERFKHRQRTIGRQKKAKPKRNAECKPGTHKQSQSDQPSEYPALMVDIRSKQSHHFSLSDQ